MPWEKHLYNNVFFPINFGIKTLMNLKQLATFDYEINMGPGLFSNSYDYFIYYIYYLFN